MKKIVAIVFLLVCLPLWATPIANLSGAYKLQAGSPAIGAGVNLTSLGITGLDTDAAGVARPATGAWDIGAYQYNGASYNVFSGVTFK